MKPDAELSAVLGTPPPAAVSALPAEVLQRLADQITEARTRQRAEMEASVQTAIAGVPFAVRGFVKKALL